MGVFQSLNLEKGNTNFVALASALQVGDNGSMASLISVSRIIARDYVAENNE